jgi:hypothetical protein
MDKQILVRHFAACHLPVEFVDVDPRRERGRPPLSSRLADNYFFVDIVTRRKREQRFRIFADDHATLNLLDKQPARRHVLLQVRSTPFEREVVNNYLLGHDERELFVVESNRVNSIRDAIEALKPFEVRRAEQRGLKVVRQGDWFFIPLRATFQITPAMILHRNETIGGPNATQWGIRVGNPHVAEEQLLIFGDAYARRFDKWERTKNALLSVYVRGKIRHEDHATIELREWHRAVQNVVNGSTATIGYFD